jgi:hypothetical protein
MYAGLFMPASPVSGRDQDQTSKFLECEIAFGWSRNHRPFAVSVKIRPLFTLKNAYRRRANGSEQ